MTPEESLETVVDVVEATNTPVYQQLRRPGLVLSPIDDLRTLPTDDPHRLLLSKQELPPTAGEATLYDGSTVTGLVSFQLAGRAGGALYLGSVSVKLTGDPELAPSEEDAAALFNRLLRAVKKRASGKVSAINSTTGARCVASQVGYSAGALQEMHAWELRWRQEGVEGVEFAPAS